MPTTYDDPEENNAVPQNEAEALEEASPVGLSLKKKRQYLAIAEVEARKILLNKKLYNEAYDVRSIHTYDLNFRVKYYYGAKLIHNILVKMNADYTVKETVFDH